MLNQTGWGLSSAGTQVQMPAGGTLQATNSYVPQGGFLSSVSPAVAVTGTPVQPLLTFTAAPQSVSFGQPITLTATLAPYQADGFTTDGETISFSSPAGATTATLQKGRAAATITTLPVGATELQASYPGDSTFLSAPSDDVAVVVTPATPPNAALSGAYVFHFEGSLPSVDGPVQAVAAIGSFVADGAGGITGIEDLNSAPLSLASSALTGTYALKPDGTGTLHLVTAQGIVQDLGIVLASRDSSGVAHTLSLVDLGSNGSTGIGGATMPIPVTGTLESGSYTLSLSGETACQGGSCAPFKHHAGSVSLLGSFVLASATGTGSALQNVAGAIELYPAASLAFLYPTDTPQRITLTMTASGGPADEPTHFVGWLVSPTEAYLLSFDPHKDFILLSGSLVSQ